MVLVDTKVLVDVVQDDPQWSDWSIGQLRAQARIHELVINAVVYAELSVSFSTIELLNRTIATMQLTLRDIPTPALFLAGKAHLRYRRRGGTRAQVLPAFFIGAHAAVEGWPLLTRDAERFRTCFAGLSVIAP